MESTRKISVKWLFLLVGVISLLALTDINARLFGIVPADVHQSVQVALLLAGCCGVGVGFAGSPFNMEISRKEFSIVVLLFVFALLLRVWQLDRAVSVPLSDEYIFIDTAIALWDKPDFPLLEPLDRVIAFIWLQPYMILVSMETLGWGVFAARLPSAIAGALTVVACYFLARELFNHRIALISALILATFPPHIHISRMALINVFDPFFGTLALALLLRGINKADSRSLAMSGLILGLTQYFHEAGRLLFPIVALLWLILSSDTFVPNLRRLTLRSVQVIVPFLLIAFPLYLTLVALDYPLFSRLELAAPVGEQTSYVLERTVPKNILSESYIQRLGGVLAFFVSHVDNSPDFYGGTQPMVLYGVFPLFFVGVFSLFWHIRQRNSQQIIVWLALAVFGIALIRIGAWTIRFAPIFPAIAIVIALGIWFVSEKLPELHRKKGMIFLLCFVLVVQTTYYFGPHLTAYNRQVRWQSDFADAFHRAVNLPLDTTVNFIDEDGIWMPYIQILRRLWKRTDLQIMHYPVEDLELEDAQAMSADGLSQVFFVHPDDESTIEILEQVFNLAGPEFSPYEDVPIDLQYALYYVTNP